MSKQNTEASSVQTRRITHTVTSINKYPTGKKKSHREEHKILASSFPSLILIVSNRGHAQRVSPVPRAALTGEAKTVTKSMGKQLREKSDSTEVPLSHQGLTDSTLFTGIPIFGLRK